MSNEEVSLEVDQLTTSVQHLSIENNSEQSEDRNEDRNESDEKSSEPDQSRTFMERRERNNLERSDLVDLICVKQGGKLRVRILTPGYLQDANCQFPRDLRVEGRRFQVHYQYIHLMTQRGRYFYSVRQRDQIKIVTSSSSVSSTSSASTVLLSSVTIFEDKDSTECMICMDEPKSMVFYPCGHYYCCESCSSRVKKCPICRQAITQSINKRLFD